ncbi:MAG TPA: hypothetical protein DEB17_11390 [Chlorobaculum sp.]|uniref:Uncharacterized protein n=1 Tax=Chlorobaculum tepidum (strain ATCC 49652 / DSM 12025 / NBRC 103806 / TLS) TaxID=194439 RepID=Q8KCS0_CHLTE|nr:hypothetical protein CT1343 [Chlorobaculum tepidum TLS]HBU24570.1 hypothetical protein [Chlorobaculum sp.]
MKIPVCLQTHNRLGEKYVGDGGRELVRKNCTGFSGIESESEEHFLWYIQEVRVSAKGTA